MFKRNRNVSLASAALIGVLLSVVPLSAQSRSPGSRSRQWPIAGQNLHNTWNQPAEHKISRLRQGPEPKMGVHNGW
jgi:hypothetical protein